MLSQSESYKQRLLYIKRERHYTVVSATPLVTIILIGLFFFMNREHNSSRSSGRSYFPIANMATINVVYHEHDLYTAVTFTYKLLCIG